MNINRDEYPVEAELFEVILNTICHYDDEMSTAAAIGVLEMVKAEVKAKALRNATDEVVID